MGASDFEEISSAVTSRRAAVRSFTLNATAQVGLTGWSLPWSTEKRELMIAAL